MSVPCSVCSRISATKLGIEDAQLVILSVGEDADGEYLDVVDDDETLMEVGALFEKRLSDNFDIG